MKKLNIGFGHKTLSLSYSTKGPFIAKAIAISEWIFGHGYLGLKFLSFDAYAATAIVLGVCSYLISQEKQHCI